MGYRSKHGSGSNRKRDAMPRRWERKQSEREAAREEAKRVAEERLGRAADLDAGAGVDLETAPFSPVGLSVDDGPDVGPPEEAPVRGRGRGRAATHAPPDASSGGWAEPASEEDGGVAATVGRVLAAIVVALALGSLLTGHRLKSGAEQMAVGPARTVALVASAPAAWLNHLLRIDRGWEGLRAWASGSLDAEGWPSGQASDAATVTASSEPTSAPWVAKRIPTNTAPLDVYICGDSLSADVGAAFVNVSVRTGSIQSKRLHRSETGLSRPDEYDWPAALKREMGSARHEAVIAMFGADDGRSVEHQGKVLRVHSPEWEALYAARVGEVMDVLTAGGQRLYWIGLPIPRNEERAKEFAMMNRVYQAEAAKRPAVVYEDSWKLFSDSSGEYSETLKDDRGEPVDMRRGDGVRFTTAGAKRMAESVLATMCRDWGIPVP